jgi:hypothetical protein
MERRFAVLRWSLASHIRCGRWFFHRAYYRLSRPVYPFFRAASLADALAGRLLFFGLTGLLPSSRYITGAYLIAIEAPFKPFFVFNNLRMSSRCRLLHYGSPEGK